MKRIPLMLSKLYPRRLRITVEQLIKYSGIKTNSNYYLGNATLAGILALIIAIALAAVTRSLNVQNILIGISAMIGVIGVYIIIPYIKAESRTREVERQLPDFFNITASNIRAGDTPITAMMNASREGFGVLNTEMQQALTVSMGSESYEKILRILTKQIKSKILKRVVELLTNSIKIGGDIAGLLEGAAEEIVRMQTLKKELITSVRSYMIFIIIIIIAGLPFLLNVSAYFVQTIKNLEVMITPSQFGPTIQTSGINLSFIVMLSYIIILATSLFSSVLIGTVIDESPIQGLKYFIPVLVLTIIVYIITSQIIPSLLGTLNL